MTIEFVEVSARDVAKIPRGNIRVPRDEFAAVWRESEHRNEALGARGESDWFNAAVCVTCRWLARATVRPETGRWYTVSAPVTGKAPLAYEELIANECLEAEKLALRRPVPDWLQRRPGWVDGILATLEWAWRRNGRPPIDVSYRAAAK